MPLPQPPQHATYHALMAARLQAAARRIAEAARSDAGSSTPSEPASHREVQRGDDTRNDSR
jgi:hypothetical protein